MCYLDNTSEVIVNVKDRKLIFKGTCSCACLVSFTEVTEEISSVCAVKAEGVKPVCRDPLAQDSTPPSMIDKSSLQQVAVKQEDPEEETDATSCCLDFVKVEDVSFEGMKWTPEVVDIQTQDSKTRLDQGM